MPFDRDGLFPGDLLICRDDPKTFDLVNDTEVLAQQRQAKSDCKAVHVSVVYGREEIAEQYFPCSRKLPLSHYDKGFDVGLVYILHFKGWTPEYAARVQGWWDCHLGMPYGVDDIGMFAADGILWWACPPLGRWIKSRDLGGLWELHPVCSQAAALGHEHGTGDDHFFKRRYNIGRGREVPGDFRDMDCFVKTQDLART